MSSGTGPASRQLYDATCRALRALWCDETASLATGALNAHLERSGQIARPQPLAPILTRLERERLIALGGGDPDRAGAELHGPWTITRVDPRLLGIRQAAE